MTAQGVKQQLQFEAKTIQRYRERIERLRSGLEGGAGIDAERVQGGAANSRLPDTISEIMRFEKEMQAVIDRIQGNYLVLLDTPLQRKVIEHRYIHWMRWDKIALKMKYSEQHIYRLHWQAMRVICEKLS